MKYEMWEPWLSIIGVQWHFNQCHSENKNVKIFCGDGGVAGAKRIGYEQRVAYTHSAPTAPRSPTWGPVKSPIATGGLDTTG